MKDAPVLHRLEYGAYLAVRGTLRLLPHTAARPLGRALGRLAWLLDGRHRRVVRRNLELAFPRLEVAERRRIERHCFRHFGELICDVLSSTRFDPAELCRHLTMEGFEHVNAARDGGRGLLAMTAHLGNWEMAAQPVGLYTNDFHVVGRPADNPFLDAELMRLRGRFGNQPIDRRGAMRQMLKVLRSGGGVGILIDQRVHARREGIEVEFFGRPAWTTPALAKLSQRTGCPVVPIFGFHEPGGNYRLRVLPPIEPFGEGEEGAVALTRRYLEVIEEQIRAAPHLWLWMHDRWREPRH